MQPIEAPWFEEPCIAYAMVDPAATLEHGIAPEHFADPRCKTAWEALGQIAKGGHKGPVDVYLLAEQMHPGRDAELVISWLIDRLREADFHRVNWPHWKTRLLERAAERQHREAARKLAHALEKASGDDEARFEAVAEFKADLAALPRPDDDEPMNLGDVMRHTVTSLGERLDAKARGDTGCLSVTTGIPWIDKKTGGGWPRGCVSILAGRTSHGKSTIAQIAALAALNAGVGVHYFCLEDSAEVFGARILAQVHGLTVADFFAGEVTDYASVLKRADVANSMPASRRFLFETKRRPLEQMVGRVERYRKQNDTGLVVIDYLSLIPLPGDSERHQEVEQAVTRLQQAAIEQGLAYVVLHQLNRSFTGRQNKQPMLSDLRDSGAIEERAAIVAFTHRPNVDEGAKGGEANAIDDLDIVLAKNKFGSRNCMASFKCDFSRYTLVRDGASW
jgi:replicative DNA helicase